MFLSKLLFPTAQSRWNMFSIAADSLLTEDNPVNNNNQHIAKQGLLLQVDELVGRWRDLSQDLRAATCKLRGGPCYLRLD